MTTNDILNAARKHKWLVFWSALLGAFLLFDLAVVGLSDFKASGRVIVVQKQTAGQDIYSVSKSTQYLTGILKEAVYSDNFFDKVLASPYHISVGDFPSTVKERRKKWARYVKVGIVRDLGVMEIKVYHANEEKAKNIAWAVANVLENSHQDYHGGGRTVEVKILDNPLIVRRPEQWYLWAALGIGLLIGCLTGGSYAIMKERAR